MIRRTDGDDFLLIAQNDHAIFSGLLAEHIGNSKFARPSPEAVAAIGAHDAGWPLHDDDAPTLNDQGLPLHVFETPTALAVRIWSASVDRGAEKLGPGAGLLVSLHQLGLADFAIRQPRARNPRDQFELNKFQHRQVERQEEFRRTLGMRVDRPVHLGLAAPGTDEAEDVLRFYFRLLVLCDRLSLELCCGGQTLFPEIDGVHPRAGETAIAVRTELVEETVLGVQPWPFDAERIVAKVPCRRVRGERFESEAAFRAAYAGAGVEELQLEVRPAEAPQD
jgi:hypothetical protein